MRTPKISPRARRAALRLGLPVHTLTGTGPAGRIVEADVQRATTGQDSGTSRQPLSGMRKTIARRLVEATQTIPHFYVRRTIAVDALLKFLETRRAAHPCSLNDLFVKAVGMAVAEFAEFRSRIEGDDLLTQRNANIGIAVGVDGGVVVPVVQEADRLVLKDLAVETRRLVQLAREKRVETNALGVFSISNLGMHGVEEFTAIINPPESGILAVGGIRETLLVEDAKFYMAKVITVNLSCDHRVVDGVAAAQFLQRIAKLLETPEELIANES